MIYGSTKITQHALKILQLKVLHLQFDTILYIQYSVYIRRIRTHSAQFSVVSYLLGFDVPPTAQVLSALQITLLHYIYRVISVYGFTDSMDTF